MFSYLIHLRYNYNLAYPSKERVVSWPLVIVGMGNNSLAVNLSNYTIIQAGGGGYCVILMANDALKILTLGAKLDLTFNFVMLFQKSKSSFTHKEISDWSSSLKCIVIHCSTR